LIRSSSVAPASFNPACPKAWKNRSKKTWASPFSSPLMFAPTHETKPARRFARSVSFFVLSPLLLTMRGDYNTVIPTIQLVRPKSRAGGIKDASHALIFTQILRGAGFRCRKASPSGRIEYGGEGMGKMGKDDGEFSSWEFSETRRLKGCDE
jgi:hypothetical protein